MSICIEHVSKSYSAYPALDDVTLEIEDGEFVALLGPSGSGKTTLLRVIAGLEEPEKGRVWFGKRDVTDTSAASRGIGFVFQHYALFGHMTVAQNIAFGLTVMPRASRPSKSQVRARVEELLELVQLPSLGARFPSELSGGQRQRVALARALARKPKILLLDEPFGALDARVRKDLRRWLRELHDRMGLTSVFVTHDQEEALELADRVVVMDHGLIEQVAGPQQIYDEPASAFVYDFVGDSNRLPVTVDEGRVLFDGQALDVPVEPGPDGPALLYFRPHDATLVDEGAAGALPMQIAQAIHLGGVTRIEGKIAGLDPLIDVRIGGRNVPPAGRSVGVRLRRARLFPAPEGGDRS